MRMTNGVEFITIEEKEKKLKITEHCFDCVFYRGQNTYQKCTALNDTDFGERLCPFKKTRRQKLESDHITKARLLRLGFKSKILNEYTY